MHVFIALVALVLGVLDAQPGSHISGKTCGKVESGMTEMDVLTLLGPPGDYAASPWIKFGRQTNAAYSRVWISEEWAIMVGFDQNQKVSCVNSSPAPKRECFDRLYRSFECAIRHTPLLMAK